MDKSKKLKFAWAIFVLIVLIICLTSLPVFAWFYLQRNMSVYAPISSPESLYIGAGHCETDRFEDIRYLYFNGIDAGGDAHWDHVFCVYGKAVAGYRLQLAYTTNNQFSYEIFNATEHTQAEFEALESAAGRSIEHVEYETHTATPEVYCYTISGEAIDGSPLNQTTDDGKVIADSSKHSATYGTYSSENVQKFAEPIYWQTADVLLGNSRDSFANYYIMRVYTNGKVANDRETDVICLSAKSFSPNLEP